METGKFNDIQTGREDTSSEVGRDRRRFIASVLCVIVTVIQAVLLAYLLVEVSKLTHRIDEINTSELQTGVDRNADHKSTGETVSREKRSRSGIPGGFGRPGQVGIPGTAPSRRIGPFGSSFSLGNFGTMTVNWNSRTCGRDGLMYYTGYVGGITDGTAGFGGSNLECIPDEISSSPATSTPQSEGSRLKLAHVNLRGVLPTTGSSNWQRTDGTLMPCSKCLLPTSDVITSFGRSTCNHEMEVVYQGLAITTWMGRLPGTTSNMICIKNEKSNSQRVSAPSSEADTAPQLRFVQVRDERTNRGGNAILNCVVCMKKGDRPQPPVIPRPEAGGSGRDSVVGEP